MQIVEILCCCFFLKRYLIFIELIKFFVTWKRKYAPNVILSIKVLKTSPFHPWPCRMVPQRRAARRRRAGLKKIKTRVIPEAVLRKGVAEGSWHSIHTLMAYPYSPLAPSYSNTYFTILFSTSRVWKWELAHKEGWAPKNWCFQTVVLEKTLESPLDCKEIKLVHPKGNQPWIFIWRTDAEAEAPILWPLNANSQLIGKEPDVRQDWGQEEKGTTEDEMVG